MTKDNGPDESRLEQLDEDIDKARKDAEDAGVIDDPDAPKFFESGEAGDELDDQTVAPPD